MGQVVRFPADRRLTLVTDLHLGDGSYTDLFGKKDREFLGLLEQADRGSDEVVFMGDSFDLLQACSLPRVLQAHPEVAGRIRNLARARRVVFLRGNHDFEAGVERAFPGARAADRVFVGPDILIEHGDRFDPWGNRETAAAGRLHNFFERLTRSFWRIPLREHRDWGNRLLHWLAHKLMIVVRVAQRALARAGYRRASRKLRRFLIYWSRTVWGDYHALFQRVRRALPQWKRTRVLILGHTHLPGDVRLGAKRYINVGSWAGNNTQYCNFDGRDFSVREWRTGRKIGDENYRFLLRCPRLPNFEEWYALFHREMLTFEA
ncbi:MAG: metallophosphoesterase family protein [Planctomycetes bacterium]|nr:metallophosphoesterase family protein [Planctomycetota bacterium]